MTPTYPADVLSFSRLVIDATADMAGVVEAMHQTIAGSSLCGMVGAAYAPVRAIARLIGCGMDAVLTPLIEMAGETQPLPEREAVLAAVNGILGDHLAATENPLAIPMPSAPVRPSPPAETAGSPSRHSPTQREGARPGAWPLHERPAMDTARSRSWGGARRRAGMDTSASAL